MDRENLSRDRDHQIAGLGGARPRYSPFDGLRHEGGSVRDALQLANILAFVRANLKMIVSVTAFCLLLGLIYIVTAPVRYTAQASLVIESANSRFSSIDDVGRGAIEDVAAVETQMQIIGSQRVALAVVRRLNLAENARFISDREDLISEAASSIRSFLRSAFAFLTLVEDTDTDSNAPLLDNKEMIFATPAEEAAARRLRSNTALRRAGASHVIEVAYTSLDPRLSSAISNALTQAYIDDRREANYEAAGHAAKWMENRVSELREQVNRASRTAQSFRAEHGLLAIGQEGTLVNEQQISQLNTRLVQAQSEMADAQARLQATQGALDNDILDIDIADASGNPLITRLREQYVTALSRLADAESRYGSDHPTTVSVREEIERFREAIRAELRRAASALHTNLAVARDRVSQLRGELDQLVSRANTSDEAQVQLQQLESIAQAYRATYESYLKRYTEIIQQQSAPILEARLISPASVPKEPSAPRKGLILVLATIFGGAAGVAGAIFLTSFDRTVRLPNQLAELGLNCLAVLPVIRAGRKTHGRKSTDERPLLQVLGERHSTDDVSLFEFAVGLQRVKTALKMFCRPGPGTGVVIGIVSALPREGKSTVSSNLASAFVSGGDHTALVDADMHHADITKYLTQIRSPKSSAGPVVIGADRLRELLQRERAGGDGSPDKSPSDLFASEEMRSVLLQLRTTFDIVILDLPPLESVPDAHAIAPLLDGILLICEWGHTPQDALETAILSLEAHQGVVIGAILNKADLKTMRMLGHSQAGGDYYYHHVKGRSADASDSASQYARRWLSAFRNVRRSTNTRREAMKLAALLALPVLLFSSCLSVQANEDHLIGPQDKLGIRVYEWRTATGEPFEWEALSGEFIVNGQGQISLPLIGSLDVVGQQPGAVADLIARRLQDSAGLLKAPTASVQIVEFRPFYVIGGIEKPGEYPYRPGLTVLQAVSIAGGMRRSPDPLISRFERDAITSRGDMRVMAALLDGLVARRARLQAEIDGAAAVTFPPELIDKKDDPAIARLMREEEMIFSSRMEGIQKKVEANKHLKDLLTGEIASLRSQVELKKRQVASARREFENVKSLVDKGLGTAPRQLALERTLAEYESRQLDLERSIIEAQVEIAEAERNNVDVRSRWREEATVELRQTQVRIEELTEKFETARRLIQEAEVTAPANLARARRSRSNLLPSYAIVRHENGEVREIPATEATPVRAGDTVRVTVPLPELDMVGPEPALKPEGPRAQLED